MIQCRGGSSETLELIRRVTARLPDEVSNLVENRIVFVAVGSAHGYGQTWRHKHLSAGSGWGDERPNWVIIFSEDGITEGLIAHEIAHAFLEHNATSPALEDEANDLASKWGFSR